MTVEAALPWLKEHGKELTERIRQGKYKPDPVRRKEIPKPDGGVRKLGIPSVKDRVVQQAVAQKLMPIYEPLFSEGSYGYRPGRSAQDAIYKIRGYAEDGYEWAVLLDLSKYFDVRQVMAEVKRYMQGWLNYYAIASMKNTLAEWNGWLRRRIRMYIWKQWKKPRTKYRNLLKLGIPEKYAWMAAMSRRGCWFTVEIGAVKRAISNERLARAGFFDLSLAYESIQSACVGRAVYRTVRTVR